MKFFVIASLLAVALGEVTFEAGDKKAPGPSAVFVAGNGV
jgi:hypothetical protein